MAKKSTTKKKSSVAKKPVTAKKPVSRTPVSKKGNPVSKAVKVAGKRIGAAAASRQKSQQKRRDSR